MTIPRARVRRLAQSAVLLAHTACLSEGDLPPQKGTTSPAQPSELQPHPPQADVSAPGASADASSPVEDAFQAEHPATEACDAPPARDLTEACREGALAFIRAVRSPNVTIAFTGPAQGCATGQFNATRPGPGDVFDFKVDGATLRINTRMASDLRLDCTTDRADFRQIYDLRTPDDVYVIRVDDSGRCEELLRMKRE